MAGNNRMVGNDRKVSNRIVSNRIVSNRMAGNNRIVGITEWRGIGEKQE
ncbi:hypothetical protein [Proteus phage 2]|nr:hypothetical protein [Proteus phage 1]QNN97927.1 hypothetical protein [Proteus phage 2]QOC55034.1 hypothetical protein [Proteus phage M4H10_20]